MLFRSETFQSEMGCRHEGYQKSARDEFLTEREGREVRGQRAQEVDLVRSVEVSEVKLREACRASVKRRISSI